jgi:murein DD-endopeptidase MepM/ murein hydrolase activator NlpD
MHRTLIRRAITIAVAGVLVLTVLGGSASATSSLDLARRRRAVITKTVLQIRREHRRDTGVARTRLDLIARLLVDRLGKVHEEDDGRWPAARKLLLRERHQVTSKLRSSERHTVHRLRELTDRRKATAAWIAQWGILQTCPVRGPVSIADDFGVVVRKPDVPVHIHQGNDMMAATGTPIVAPFDGTAVAAPNVLGGMAVKVYGDLGYVYNAHLSAYGQLGQVRTGTVIGYVGSTGDAGGPHDHFEWHPNDGPAVDPNPFLSVSCG